MTAGGGTCIVSFGSVTVVPFERCLGATVVPDQGGWPLGLSPHPISAAAESTTTCTVDDFEEAKRERLELRAKELPDPNIPLETRQWDYKRRSRGEEDNPLFHRLTEPERRDLLLGIKDETPKIVTPRPNLRNQSETVAVEKYTLRSFLRKTLSRSRSDPMLNPDRKSQRNTQNKLHRHRRHRSTWSESDDDDDDNDYELYYNEKFPKPLVQKQRRHLELLRESRLSNVGCSCSHKNKLPPHLTLSIIQQELRNRGKLPQHCDMMTSRALLSLLQKVVAQEPCCTTNNNCACVRDGVECQSNVCNCAWESLVATSASSSSKNGCTSSKADPRTFCANPRGMNVLDVDRIKAERSSMLESLQVCPFVGDADTSLQC